MFECQQVNGYQQYISITQCISQ